MYDLVNIREANYNTWTFDFKFGNFSEFQSVIGVGAPHFKISFLIAPKPTSIDMWLIPNLKKYKCCKIASLDGILILEISVLSAWLKKTSCQLFCLFWYQTAIFGF